MNYDAIFAEAHEAGNAAAMSAVPRPMVVGEAKSLFSDEIDYSKPVYYESEGLCGFAWISFLSGRGPAVSYMKAKEIGRKPYGQKGWQIWVSGYGQSYERKMAYAEAYSKVMRANGIDAYADGRLD